MVDGKPMGEWVPADELKAGDWVAQLAGTDLGADLRVEVVQHGFGSRELGVRLSDGQSIFLAEPSEGYYWTAYRATPDEAVMLEIQETAELGGKKRARVLWPLS